MYNVLKFLRFFFHLNLIFIFTKDGNVISFVSSQVTTGADTNLSLINSFGSNLKQLGGHTKLSHIIRVLAVSLILVQPLVLVVT